MVSPLISYVHHSVEDFRLVQMVNYGYFQKVLSIKMIQRNVLPLHKDYYKKKQKNNNNHLLVHLQNQ